MSNGCRYEVTIRYKYYNDTTIHRPKYFEDSTDKLRLVYSDSSYIVFNKSAIACYSVEPVKLPDEDNK